MECSPSFCPLVMSSNFSHDPTVKLTLALCQRGDLTSCSVYVLWCVVTQASNKYQNHLDKYSWEKYFDILCNLEIISVQFSHYPSKLI